MRKIYAPGVEVNEIDRSGYQLNSDESLIDTATLVMGFADKGIDYKTNFINNMNTFTRVYGEPTTEAERYLYHAAKEVITKRGVLYCAKLPYFNESKDKYSFTTYKVDTELKKLKDTYSILSKLLPVIDEDDLLISLVEYSSPRNSFIDVLSLHKLPMIYLKSLNDFLNNTNRVYDFVVDLMDYVYILSNLDISKKIAFTYFFRNPMGLKRLEYILSHTPNDINTQYDLGQENKDDIFGISSIEDREDIKEILILLQNEYPNGMDQVIKTFCKLVSIPKFKNYYANLVDIFQPLLDKPNEYKFTFPGETLMNNELSIAAEFKADYRNLKYFCDEKFYIDHKDILLQEYGYTAEDWQILTYRYGDLVSLDEYLSSYVEIKSIESNAKNSNLMSMNDLDDLKTYRRKPPKNTFLIVDISKTRYDKTADYDLECIGILPVITTASNALFFKSIERNDATIKHYNLIDSILTVFNERHMPNLKDENDLIGYYDPTNPNYLFENVLRCNIDGTSYSDIALNYFPEIQYTASLHINKNYLKQIGVVVFQMKKSAENGNRIILTPVESFVGSLDRNGRDLNKNTLNFIDDIINENSSYINFFSNVEFISKNNATKYTAIENASLFLIQNLTATALGFYKHQCEKTIKVEDSIIKPIEKILDTNKNIDEINIDIVLDAGVSTIAQFIESTTKSDSGIGWYDLSDIESKNFNLQYESGKINHKRVRSWRKVADLYNQFCKFLRKDCIFLLDALRCTCLEGNLKSIRGTNLKNTIDNTVIPNLISLINLNTSYGAGYCNWVYVYDDYSGIYFWLPPSIKTAGKIILNDIYYNYWDPPAGFNRGGLNDVFDVAFNPTILEAGRIYNNSWNYIVNYPIEGPVIEGQKTFQIDKTAFDRLNVRRLFLKLEKAVYRISKRFCYEGNTEFIRSRFVDTITPMFEEAKVGGGIGEYYIICNEKNNTINTIENHELHCTIAVRPIKSIEFIILNFIALPQSGTFSEDELLNISANRYNLN